MKTSSMWTRLKTALALKKGFDGNHSKRVSFFLKFLYGHDLSRHQLASQNRCKLVWSLLFAWVQFRRDVQMLTEDLIMALFAQIQDLGGRRNHKQSFFKGFTGSLRGLPTAPAFGGCFNALYWFLKL